MKKINNHTSNQFIDYKTRQLLFFHCHLKLIKQIFIKNNETFNETYANYLLNKYLNKHRKSKCIAYFLIDRIRFKQYKNVIYIKPFRKEIIYREIKHFFIFPNYPQLFMLCIINENNNHNHNKKSYELYQCMNYNDNNSNLNLNSNLIIHNSNDYSINNNNNLIKKESIKRTSNLVCSNKLQLYQPKFYSLYNLYSNKSEYVNPKMNITKNNVYNDYSASKLFPIPYNNNNNNNNEEEEEKHIYVKDNKLYKQKTLNSTSSTSPLSLTTFNDDYDFDKYIHTKQDIYSTNYPMNFKFNDTKRNSIDLNQHLSQPLDCNHDVRMLKTLTIPTGSKVYYRKKDLNIYHDNVNVKMNDYGFYTDYDDDDYNHLENKLRKCKSNIDIGSADTTYLCYDPVVGLRINNKGPIYMYMARYNSTVISSSHDCVDLETY
uniref:Trematode PH-like domain-containing protein n=1 Tax=Schistosoma haematobium TaxID=6185 RepID=A0A094ZMV3_SCHHA